jgi:methylthioribulose-1-phosphate dehydratase
MKSPISSRPVAISIAAGGRLGTSSNYSVVVSRDPLTLLMTGSGFDKGSLQPEQFVIVDENAVALDETAFLKPSLRRLCCIPLLAKHGAGAVLHTHSVAATVLSEHFLNDGGLCGSPGTKCSKASPASPRMSRKP